MHKLNARFVESVKPTTERQDILDSDVRGLALRVSRHGVKTWAFRYRRESDGTRRNITLGVFPDYSLDDARTWAAELRAAVARGEDPAGGKAEAKAAETFRQVVAEWQASHAEVNRSERVRKDDQSMLDRYILPALGGMKARNVGWRELSRMLNTVKAATDGRQGHTKKGRKPRRLTHRPNRVFQLVRTILRWALEQGIITADPTLGKKKPIKKEKARERELSPGEIEVFWKDLEALPITPGLRIAMRLSLVTAQRIGECAGIAKSELVLDGPAPVWTLPGARQEDVSQEGTAKNDETTRVPLSRLAVALIREAWAVSGESDWLFPSPRGNGPIEGHAAAVAMFRGRKTLGLANVRTHDLRRTAASRMGEMSINPHTISLILNHRSASKSTVTDAVYLKYSFDREKREALNAWGARLEAIVEGKDTSNVVPLKPATA